MECGGDIAAAPIEPVAWLTRGAAPIATVHAIDGIGVGKTDASTGVGAVEMCDRRPVIEHAVACVPVHGQHPAINKQAGVYRSPFCEWEEGNQAIADLYDREQ